MLCIGWPAHSVGFATHIFMNWSQHFSFQPHAWLEFCGFPFSNLSATESVRGCVVLSLNSRMLSHAETPATLLAKTCLTAYRFWGRSLRFDLVFVTHVHVYHLPVFNDKRFWQYTLFRLEMLYQISCKFQATHRSHLFDVS